MPSPRPATDLLGRLLCNVGELRPGRAGPRARRGLLSRRPADRVFVSAVPWGPTEGGRKSERGAARSGEPRATGGMRLRRISLRQRCLRSSSLRSTKGRDESRGFGAAVLSPPGELGLQRRKVVADSFHSGFLAGRQSQAAHLDAASHAAPQIGHMTGGNSRSSLP